MRVDGRNRVMACARVTLFASCGILCRVREQSGSVFTRNEHAEPIVSFPRRGTARETWATPGGPEKCQTQPQGRKRIQFNNYLRDRRAGAELGC